MNGMMARRPLFSLWSRIDHCCSRIPEMAIYLLMSIDFEPDDELMSHDDAQAVHVVDILIVTGWLRFL